jgi:hypothetical protein
VKPEVLRSPLSKAFDSRERLRSVRIILPAILFCFTIRKLHYRPAHIDENAKLIQASGMLKIRNCCVISLQALTVCVMALSDVDVRSHDFHSPLPTESAGMASPDSRS